MSKVYVFDIDNTLINTQAKVLVKNQVGEVIKELSSHEYNNRSQKHYSVSDMDFSEFSDLAKLLQEPLLPTWYKFKQMYESGEINIANFFICTCRENTFMIRDWLWAHQIYLPIVNIITNDPRIFEKSEDVKIFTIKYLASRFDEIEVYEDEERFIKVMKEAAEEYPACKITFEAI